MNAQRNDKIQRKADNGNFLEDRAEGALAAEEAQRVENADRREDEAEHPRTEDGHQVFFGVKDAENQNAVFGEIRQLLGNRRPDVAGDRRNPHRDGRGGRGQPQNALYLAVKRLQDARIGLGTGKQAAQNEKGYDRKQDAENDPGRERKLLIAVHG